MVRRLFFTLLLGLTFTFNETSAHETLSLNPFGDIQLESLEGSNDQNFYLLKHIPQRTIVSIRLFGHISQNSEKAPVYLKQPRLVLEQKKMARETEDWIVISESGSPGNGIETCSIQNVFLEPDDVYRVIATTDSSQGGQYALIVDPAIEGMEIEMEDLDFGCDPYGNPQSLSTAYVVPDPSTPGRSRIYAGTESGYLLLSEDDGNTWKQIYPQMGIKPHGSIYGLFIDSHGIIYLSEWTSQYDVRDKHRHGALMESRDGGMTWIEAIDFQWPTGVAWRMCEDFLGNVFVGEYSATWPYSDSMQYNGNIWRRKNYGYQGELFEIVYANPSYHEVFIDPAPYPNSAWCNNHVHFIDVDPYTGDVYATIGDGILGRFLRSKQHGDPGTWETLERGVDSQYTAIVFTPDFLFLGQDTNNLHKKVVRGKRDSSAVYGSEPFWTTVTMISPGQSPRPYFDRGNWFWGHYLPDNRVLWMQYLPYGVDTMPDGHIQSPRLFASNNQGESWWQAITFPPLPEKIPYGFYGPKMASNIGPDGWVYAMRGTISENIHRGFRFRFRSNTSSSICDSWEDYQ